MSSSMMARRGARSVNRHIARSGCTGTSPHDARPIEDVWAEYKRTGARELRNYLMEKYLHLVRFNAERVYARLPDEVDIEDLMSSGLFGLMEAIDNYELDRNVKFETFCATRIRGSILDELRNMDWVPRLVRYRTAKVEQARMALEMRSGEPASDDEVAQHLNVDPEEFEKYIRDSSPVSMSSIDRKCFSSDGSRELREIDVIRDNTQSNPVLDLQRKDLRTLITKGLTRAERLIVVLYYYENMTMKEIGATLALSESRVSQMHSSILMRLKAQMQHRMRELEPMKE